METTIVYIDDDAHALAILAPLLQTQQARQPARWILVACAPRITQRVSKWGTNSGRANWRGKWAGKMFEQVMPIFQACGDPVIRQVMHGALDEFTQRLHAEYGSAVILDARKPKPAQESAPIAVGFPRSSVWNCAAMLTGPALMALAE